MKKLIGAIIIAISLPMLISSCQKEDSADVNQDTIYTVYELFYNENSDKTVAICRLRFGSPTGTLLEAIDPAGVTFNGDILPYSAAYSGHAKEYAGLITSGTFSYTNTEGTVFTNTPPAMNTLSTPIDFDTIIKSQANTYTWIGNALNADERVNLFVGTWSWGQDAAFFASGNGTTDIVMGVNQLSNLAETNSTLYVDRVHEVAITQGTAEGGVIRTRYRPLNQSVLVLP